MTTKSAAVRRKFRTERDEIDYLYHKVLYWLYDRADAAKALPFGDRLERLLEIVSPDHQAILGEECRSLISEARGDLRSAIRYRESEIRLIKRLHEISLDSSARAYVLERYDYSDLSDRLDLLAVLYHDSGDLVGAIRILHESRRLCEKHGIPFDGQDLLDEYLEEQRDVAATVKGNNGKTRRKLVQKQAQRTK